MFIAPAIGHLVLAGVALVMWTLLRGGAIARNASVGIRTRYTLRSDQAWDAGQRAALPYLLGIAISSAGFAIALFVMSAADVSEPIGNVVAVGGFAITLLVAAFAARASNAAARTTI